MTESDNRDRQRDSLFLMADVRMRGENETLKVRVRNLSEGGMMAEGEPAPARGQSVSISLRNIGWVEGSVAWVQDNRFGIAFAQNIDPMLARAPVSAEPGLPPRFTRPVGDAGPNEERIRKI